MRKGECKSYQDGLRIVEPEFGSELTDLIIELDHLRKKQLEGSTHPRVFFQLKEIFHILESIGSARIEGNRTTIAQYFEAEISGENPPSEEILEIKNIKSGMDFIDDNIEHTPINRMFLCELHKRVVENLATEGSYTPGEYRKKNVVIAQSRHVPPDFTRVGDYMQDFLDFINQELSSKYDLLKTALAHHRFVWIHPFDNGNGRTVRLLTYAMLVKQGFNVRVGRILNPTAIFCHDRNQYYSALERADLRTEEHLLEWCTYVLKGLKDEIEKIDHLLDYDYLRRYILIPAIHYSHAQKLINDYEANILQLIAQKQIIQAADLNKVLLNKRSSSISRTLRKLREKKMIMPEKENGRKYILRFDNSYLSRGIIKNLADNGFIPPE